MKKELKWTYNYDGSFESKENYSDYTSPIFKIRCCDKLMFNREEYYYLLYINGTRFACFYNIKDAKKEANIMKTVMSNKG